MATARTIMTTDVFCVTKDANIYDAIQTLVANNVTGLPVVDGKGMLVGVVTEKDVLQLLYNVKDHPGTVADFMSHNVVAFDQEDNLCDLVESFKTNHFRRVPILDKGRLVGIVSRKDIIRYINEQQPARTAGQATGSRDPVRKG